MSNQVISIIIVNYRSSDFTEACLKSIYSNIAADEVEIVVVDNASYDGCDEMMRSKFPGARFVQSSENLGFSGANNLGIAQSRGEYLLFLNPDTEIQGNAIRALRDALVSAPNAGMVGARLLNSDLSVQTTSITAFPSLSNQILGIDFLRTRFPMAGLWGMRPLFQNLSAPVVVDAISGACMMATRSLISRVGGFTPDYFMYSEDLDLCLKVGRQGKQIYYTPAAVIVHHGGGSSGLRSESDYAAIMIRESMCRFMLLHRGWSYACIFRVATALVAVVRLLVSLLLMPSFFVLGRIDTMKRIFSKWTRILAWSAGLQTWIRSKRSNTKGALPALLASNPPNVAD